jgi:cobalamin transport system substrate-binding protein
MRLAPLLLAASCARLGAPSVSTRIVTTAPSITEIAFALGLGPSIVGVSDYCRFPPEAARRTRVGPYLAPSLERILALRPGLVLLDEVQAGIAQGLEHAGVRTVRLRMQGLQDVRAGVRAVGRAAGREREAAALLARFDQALDRGPRLRGRPRVLLIVGRDPGTFRNLVACGPSSFAGELLRIAGARNVFDDVERPYFQISTEGVLARAPDTIVEIVDAAVDPEAARRQWFELAAVAAVRAGRVHILQNLLPTTPGPRAPEALAVLVRTIEPPW